MCYETKKLEAGSEKESLTAFNGAKHEDAFAGVWVIFRQDRLSLCMDSCEQDPVSALDCGKELLREYSGFFHKSIFKLDNGDTLWQFVRTRDREVYLSYRLSRKLDRIELLSDHTESAGSLAFEYLTNIFPL